MADQSDEPEEVDFIPAYEDANLRLRCYEACAVQGFPFEATLGLAKKLYAWCWETEESEPDALELGAKLRALESKH